MEISVEVDGQMGGEWMRQETLTHQLPTHPLRITTPISDVTSGP
jgi:hypothetical protein